MSYSIIKTARYDLWKADGSPDFGLLPTAVAGISEGPAPIRLQRGDNTFGACHIEERHGHWVRLHAASAPELVWTKCRQVGTIYSAEEPEKGKIWLPIHPAALMVLRYVPRDGFWTVVSLYFHEGPLDGMVLGRYTDTLPNPPAVPAFSIRDFPATPKIVYKPRRKTKE